MRSGYAFHVRHPRRTGQDYVSCDVNYVADDVLRTTRDLGWPVRVSLIAYRGDGALACNFQLSKLLDALPSSAAAWLQVEGCIGWGEKAGVLVGTGEHNGRTVS